MPRRIYLVSLWCTLEGSTIFFRVHLTWAALDTAFMSLMICNIDVHSVTEVSQWNCIIKRGMDWPEQQVALGSVRVNNFSYTCCCNYFRQYSSSFCIWKRENATRASLFPWTWSWGKTWFCSLWPYRTQLPNLSTCSTCLNLIQILHYIETCDRRPNRFSIHDWVLEGQAEEVILIHALHQSAPTPNKPTSPPTTGYLAFTKIWLWGSFRIFVPKLSIYCLQI